MLINSLSKQTGAFCTHIHFRVTRGKLVIFTNVGAQVYNVHIVDFLPFLDSVIYFGSFDSTPVQGISNIHWRVLNIGVQIKFIFKARIFGQQFSNFTPADRNNLTTSVFDYLQPRFGVLIRVLQSSFNLTDVFVSIGHVKTPMPKAPRGSPRLHSSLRSSHKFSHYGNPAKRTSLLLPA